MPLIVYLDTQDYISLFNEKGDGPNHKILDALLKHRDRGEIVIGFSWVTVAEFITKPDAANRSERVRRGQLIKDICGRNAFPDLVGLRNGAAFPNGGMWVFDAGTKVITAQRFRNQMHNALLEQLASESGINRKQRRQLGRMSAIPELARQAASTWGRKRSDWGDIPISEEFLQSRVLERWMKGECSDREFEERLNAWFSDPAEFSRVVYDYADQPNLIDKHFGKTVTDIASKVKVLQDAVAGITSVNTRILDIRTRLVEAGVEKSKARRAIKQVSMPEIDAQSFDQRLAEAFGKNRIGHFRHYLTQAMDPSYRFLSSDVMDLFQMLYAYDCDLFRCDKAMANTFRRYEPFEKKLVSRFRDLPDRIAKLLADTLSPSIL